MRSITGVLHMTASSLISFILGLIIAAGSAFWSWSYFAPTYLPPTKYISTVVLNSPVEAGQEIIATVRFDKRRNCAGVTDRFVIHLNKFGGEELVFRDAQPTTLSVIGEALSLTWKTPVPFNAEAGNYVLRAIARYDCDGRIFTLELPTAPFQVQ